MDLTARSDHELLEVPLDFAGFAGGIRRLGELAVERVLVASVHLDLLEHGKGDPVGERAKLFDRVGAAQFLQKLVARETEDGESTLAVGFLELLKGFVLAGETAAGGDIDDEQHLAGVLREGRGGTVDGGQRNVGNEHAPQPTRGGCATGVRGRCPDRVYLGSEAAAIVTPRLDR